jgi:hypothetical protein
VVGDTYLDIADARFEGSLATAGLERGQYTLEAYLGAGQLAYVGATPHIRIADEIPTAVEQVEQVPAAFALHQNAPNPFNGRTAIRFRVPGRAAAPVELAIFNLLGQQVATLLSAPMSPGEHVAYWDGRTDGGQAAASGTYIYRLRAGHRATTRRLTLLQ